MSKEVLVLTKAISIKRVIKSILNDSGQDLKMVEFDSLNNLMENLRTLNYSVLVLDLDIADKEDIKSNSNIFDLEKTILLTSNFSDSDILMLDNVVTKPAMPGVLKSLILSVLDLAEKDSNNRVLDEIKIKEDFEHNKGVDHFNIEKSISRDVKLQEVGGSSKYQISKPRIEYPKPVSAIKEEINSNKKTVNPVIDNEEVKEGDASDTENKEGLSSAVSQFMKRFIP